MKDLIIIGAGGVGREVALIINQINSIRPTWNIIGYVDDDNSKKGEIINGIKVIGNVKELKEYNEDLYVVIAIANYEVKKNIVNKLNSKFKFATIIHPKVFTHDFMTIGEGSIIYEGVIITANVEIGKHVIISPKCGIGHDSKLRDYVSLLWNVNVSGNDIIEEGVLMGSGSTVIQNKKIGQGAVIGAGAVVVKNVLPFCTAIGIPAKAIKKGENLHEKGAVYNNC